MKTKILCLSAVCMLLGLVISCEKKESPVEAAADVTDLEYTAEERTVTLTWSLPKNEEVIAVQIVHNGTDFWEEEGAVTRAVIENVEVGVEQMYTVRVITPKSISQGVSIKVLIDAGKMAMPAMLLLSPDPEALPDDDEIAAAVWFREHYVNAGLGAFVYADQLGSLSVKDYSMLFIIVDRVGMGQGWMNLPPTLISEAALKGLSDYVAEGGCLFVAKMATQLVVAIERIDAKYSPGIYGSGEGALGSDTWCINANIGMTYDHRSHPIFQSLDRNTTEYSHETYGMLGPGGFREDHNCMWDCNAYGFPGNPDVIANFEEATTSSVLATWGHVVDYCCAGIVEFKPTATHKGTIIANGMSAYEFKQNNQDNQYQSNLERLTENTINYLSKLGLQ